MKLLNMTSLRLATYMTTMVLGTFAALSSASASSQGSGDLVVAIDMKTISSSAGLLKAFEVASGSAFVDDADTPGGVCVANSKISAVTANPSARSPLQSPYIVIKVTWYCEAARDLLIKKIQSVQGLTVWPYSVIIGLNPAVIRAN